MYSVEIKNGKKRKKKRWVISIRELTSGGCSCSPWGGLLFDPVVQMHMKRRRKRQDPTGQRGESRQKMERHMTKQEGMKRKSRDRHPVGYNGLVLDTLPHLNNHRTHNINVIC